MLLLDIHEKTNEQLLPPQKKQNPGHVLATLQRNHGTLKHYEFFSYQINEVSILYIPQVPMLKTYGVPRGGAYWEL